MCLLLASMLFLDLSWDKNLFFFRFSNNTLNNFDFKQDLKKKIGNLNCVRVRVFRHHNWCRWDDLSEKVSSCSRTTFF